MDTNQPNNQEQQTPGYSNQPPAGGAPYQPPQQQQYQQQPPQQPYQPQQSPYQQQQQPYGYQQAPPPPPQQKKGFNWLACCGITCLVLVIIGGGIAFCSYKMVAPFMDIGLTMANLEEEVKNTDVSVMRSSAVAVDTATLYNNPNDYKGTWLEVTGEVVHDDGSSEIGADTFASGEFVTYILEDHVVLMDVTNSPEVGVPGDTIRAYGKCYGWDLMELEKMPFVGKTIADEMRSDPQLAGNTKLVFFIGKGVELVEGGSGGGSSSGGGNTDTGGDGWVR